MKIEMQLHDDTNPATARIAKQVTSLVETMLVHLSLKEVVSRFKDEPELPTQIIAGELMEAIDPHVKSCGVTLVEIQPGSYQLRLYR